MWQRKCVQMLKTICKEWQIKLTKLHVMQMCRSCGDLVGRRAQFSTLLGCVCSALRCWWRGDDSCHWVTLEMGLKIWEEAFLAPFMTTHWKSTVEFNSEREMGSLGGEDRKGSRSQTASDLGKELGGGGRAECWWEDKQGLSREPLPLDRLPWRQKLCGWVWTKPQMRLKRTELPRKFTT